MAKGQQRSTKEQRKPKSNEKKESGPRYLRQTELPPSKLGAQPRPGQKK